MNKLLACLLLFALAFSQVAISAHAVFHPDHFAKDHVVYSGHAQDEQNNDHQNNKKHQCPECLLAKSFSAALPQDYIATFVMPDLLGAPFIFLKQSKKSFLSSSYHARAPPEFLI